MTFETIQLDEFFIIGISVRTINQNGQSQKDIAGLWVRFMQENIMDIIPDKITNEIYCIYTDYSNDFNGGYTTLLGCKVFSIHNVPERFTGKTISAGNYQLFLSTGKIPDSVVATWEYIWSSKTERKYLADFDVYGIKAHEMDSAEV